MRRSTLIVLLVGIGFAAFVFYALFGIEPVHVVRSGLVRTDRGVYVEGVVRNTASKPRGIDLEVHYYGPLGRQVGQDTLHLDDLPAGAIRDFHSPPRSLPAVQSFSIYLNHGRNPYGN